MIARTTISCLMLLLCGLDLLQPVAASWLDMDRTIGSSWLDAYVRDIVHRSSSATTSMLTTSANMLFHSRSNNQKETPNATTHTCRSEEDLNDQDCALEDLDEATLKSICDRMGINIHDDVFTFTLPNTNDAQHHDYVRAAYECLMTEKEIQEMIFQNNIPEDYVDADTQAMADLLVGIMENEPQLLSKMEEDMKEEAPDLWKSLRQNLDNDEGTISPGLLVDALMKISA